MFDLLEMEQIRATIREELIDFARPIVVKTESVKPPKMRKPRDTKQMRETLAAMPEDGSEIASATIIRRLGVKDMSNACLCSRMKSLLASGKVERVSQGVYRRVVK